ncbi:MAG: response regulator [Deltaproteobacteria bacterium]|nr:response regulator [Deltaproteobacteria bacterium]
MLRRLLPTLLALPILVVALAWFAAERAAREQQREESSLTAGQAALRLEDYVGARLLAADTIRLSLQRGDPLEERAFRRRADQVQERFGGFLALNWIDADGVIRWVSPLEPNRSAAGRNVNDHPTAGPFFRQAIQQHRDVATGPITLFQGQRGFASYLPMNERHLGYLNAVFDAERLVEGCFTSGLLDAWEVQVMDGGELVYQTPRYETSGAEHAGTAALRVVDRTWSLRVRPTNARRTDHNGPFRRAVFAVALFFAFALGVAVQLLQLRTRQKDEAERAQLAMSAELLEARRLEALGQLAGGVAHDVNNLLTTISGSAALLEDASIGAEMKATLSRDILEACRHGAELTSGLLAYSRQQIIQPRALETTEELARAEGLLARLVRENIQWERQVDPELWPVLMDPGEFNRVLLNLIANAVDAMPEGGVLGLRAENVPGDQSRPDGVRITVTDSGHGIPDAIRERIFDPFFTTKGPGRGTGLGLASVHGAVTAAGGTITLESSSGEGARFSVWLPCTEDAPESLPPTLEPTSPLARRVVLLVEDQPSVRKITKLILEREGHEVLAAGHADEARGLFMGRGDVQVLVTDVVMPDVSGPELAKALRRERPDLAIVFTSGHAQEQLDPEVLADPRCTYIPKPFDRAQLTDAISSVLG